MSQQKLPAGKYYIGDPCYVIDNAMWDQFCGGLWDTNDPIFDFDGYDVGVLQTAYGDGCYEASDGSMLGVDAGIIGAIPAVLMVQGSYDEGTEVVFDKPFSVHADADGTLHFGNFTVKTGDEDDYGDEECCSECGR